MKTEVTSNKRRAVAVLAGPVALVAVVTLPLALAFDAVPLVLVAVVIAGLVAALAWWRSDGAALRLAGAEPADGVVHARLHNLVEGLCTAGGVPKPRLYVVDDEAPNAFSCGRDPRRAAIVVTSGLLDKLSRIELEGVLAHEISHIKNHDILVSTLAVTLATGRLALSPQREALADVAGVALTRYPPGLIAALEKLRDDTTVVRSASRATAHLWIDAPTGRTTHPPLEERIQALREL